MHTIASLSDRLYENAIQSSGVVFLPTNEGLDSRSDTLAKMCAAIRRAIVEQALRPGDRLPEDSLGERFGVSRTIARQALGQLASEGLVELRRNRIAVVATPSLEEARDIFDIRIELEKLVARSLVGKLDQNQIARLREHVAKESDAMGGPNAGAIRLATDFHVLLAEMSGKPVLIRYLREVSNRCALTLSVFGRPHSSECAISEHTAIIAAIEKGDAVEVTDLMHHHMVGVADRALLPQTQRGDLMEILAPYVPGQA